MSNYRYPIKISKYGSHQQIRSFLVHYSADSGRKLSLLDIGCSTAGLGDALDDLPFNYKGVEPFESDCLIAVEKGHDVISCSVEQAFDRLSEVFDFVVYADVLEHLVDPADVLKKSKALLDNRGILIISVPNVAHLWVRLQLMMGQWNYTERGILDKTHLRFFTRRSITKLVEENGFEILMLKVTPIPLESVLPFRENIFWKFLDLCNYIPAKFFPRVFGFQFLLIVKESRVND
jgi:2-polyprenyl-3-methyl-5-hydroxy-6-metoxy-1,4-benzoquinol methylase